MWRGSGVLAIRLLIGSDYRFKLFDLFLLLRIERRSGQSEHAHRVPKPEVLAMSERRGNELRFESRCT